ncbi:MAG: restriction endonuclease subunit S [Crocosphaera sp.]|nr:restriction endonuclease subunit S [Crocosphaera sp.]
MEQQTIKMGYKLTDVGVIPDDWEVKKVGDICDFIVPGRNKPKNFDGDIPWITTPDLEDGRRVYKSKIDLYISKNEAQNIGSKIVPAGSVIMSCAGELGIVAFTENDIVINQQLHAFIPSPVINTLFLMNAIKTRKDYINSIATKTAVPYLNKNNCNSIPIPIPPLNEQKKIAEVLSDVDKAIERLEKLLTKKRNIKQGTMQLLLTGKKRLPGFTGEWEVKKLGECLIKNPDYGINASAVPYSYSLPTYIRITDISENGRFLTKNKASIDHQKAYDYLLQCGDIVLARTGASTGKSYLYKEKDGQLVFAGFLIRVKADYNKLYPQYLKIYLETQYYWNWVKVMSMRSGQPNFGQNITFLYSVIVL